MPTIAIVGAGLMGTAVAWPLADNGHEVRLVGTHLDTAIIESCLARRYHPRLRRTLPDGVRPYYVEQVADALHGADVIVSGVNSLGVHWIGRTLAPLLWPGATVIAVTKGLEAGPDGAPHILPDGAAVERLRTIFATGYYHIWLSTDLVGVEACAALKNAYTLAVGLAGGMLERVGGIDSAGAGMHNLAAALFGASAAEMTRLVTLMGGRPEKVIGLPGVGDQYVTCVGGRTIRLGHLLGRGLTYSQAVHEMAGETLEGAYVVRQLAQVLPAWEERGLIGRQDLPLLRMLCRVIVEDAPAEIPFDDFFGMGTRFLPEGGPR
jgi:glycerol-3-phosphate dehydrogenase (NAD(P)+)